MSGYGQFCPGAKTTTICRALDAAAHPRAWRWVDAVQYAQASPAADVQDAADAAVGRARTTRPSSTSPARRDSRSLDPLIRATERGIALADARRGRHEGALRWAGRVLARQPDEIMTLRAGAVVHAAARRIDEAGRLVARIRRLDPALRLSDQSSYLPYRRPEDFARCAEALHIAGLPE